MRMEEVNWSERMARTYSRGLELGQADYHRSGKDLVEQRAYLYQFEGCFRQGYAHGQSKAKNEVNR